MNDKLLKKSFFYLGGTIVVAIGGFIISLLYSYFFDTKSYGNYCLIFSVYSLASNFLAGWLSTSIIRNFESYKLNKQEKELIGTIFKYLLFVSVLVIILISLSVFIIKFDYTLKIIIILFAFVFFFEYAILIMNTLYRIEENIKQYNTNTILNSLLKIVTIIILYYLFGVHNIIIIPLGLLITEFFQFIIISKKLKIHNTIKFTSFNFRILKNLFMYGFPLMGISITSWILNTSDRFVIAYYFGSSEVGLYSYAYSLANSIFTLLIQFIMLGAYPNIIKNYEKGQKNAAESCITDYLNIYMLVLIPLCTGATIVAKDFFELFTSIRYQESFSVFIITSISIFVLGLTQYYNKPFELKKDTKKILLINVAVAFINIVLNFIFMDKIGYIFGAWSTLISYLFYIVISILCNNTEIRIKYDYKIIFKIILSTFNMILIIFVVNKIVSNQLYSFLLKIIIGGLVYLCSIFLYRVVDFKKIKRKKYVV